MILEQILVAGCLINQLMVFLTIVLPCANLCDPLWLNALYFTTEVRKGYR